MDSKAAIQNGIMLIHEDNDQDIANMLNVKTIKNHRRIAPESIRGVLRRIDPNRRFEATPDDHII
jgi:hypothetical protein